MPTSGHAKPGPERVITHRTRYDRAQCPEPLPSASLCSRMTIVGGSGAGDREAGPLGTETHREESTCHLLLEQRRSRGHSGSLVLVFLGRSLQSTWRN